MTVFYDVEYPSREEDQSAQQSLIKTITLILPLEETTVNNPSDSNTDSVVTAIVTVEQHQERWQSKIQLRYQLQSLNDRIQGY